MFAGDSCLFKTEQRASTGRTGACTGTHSGRIGRASVGAGRDAVIKTRPRRGAGRDAAITGRVAVAKTGRCASSGEVAAFIGRPAAGAGISQPITESKWNKELPERSPSRQRRTAWCPPGLGARPDYLFKRYRSDRQGGNCRMKNICVSLVEALLVKMKPPWLSKWLVAITVQLVMGRARFVEART